MRLQHVKAHGALYNMAVRDATLADAIARATASVDRSLILFGLPGSELSPPASEQDCARARGVCRLRFYRPGLHSSGVVSRAPSSRIRSPL